MSFVLSSVERIFLQWKQASNREDISLVVPFSKQDIAILLLSDIQLHKDQMSSFHSQFQCAVCSKSVWTFVACLWGRTTSFRVDSILIQPYILARRLNKKRHFNKYARKFEQKFVASENFVPDTFKSKKFFYFVFFHEFFKSSRNTFIRRKSGADLICSSQIFFKFGADLIWRYE